MADDALYTYVTTTGVIIPDTADIKAVVQAEWKAALGDNLDVSDSSPQGVLIAAETASRAAWSWVAQISWGSCSTQPGWG